MGTENDEKRDGLPPGCMTAGQAVERSGLNPQIFSWLVQTEGIELPRFGKRAVYTPEVIEKILDIYRAKDPQGRFLARPGRKNGPSKKKERCATCGKRVPQEYKVAGKCPQCAIKAERASLSAAPDAMNG